MARGKIAAKVGRAACPHAAEGGVLATTAFAKATVVKKTTKTTKAMKPSGVAWFGDIPEEWEVKRLKCIASCNDESLADDTPSNFSFDYVDVGSVKYGLGIVERESMLFADAPSRARRVVRKDDVIVSTVRTYLKSVAQIPPFNKPLIVSTGFAVLRARNADAIFLSYALQSQSFVDEVEAKSTGISYPAINASDLVCIKVPVPPLPEQRAIADYLDEKCGAIDAAIAEAKKGIEEYKAWKKSLIFEAVTGKRRVGAFNAEKREAEKIKPSGIPWIGAIPEGWAMIKASKIFSVITDFVASGSFADLRENVKYLDCPDYAQLIRTADVSGKSHELKAVYISKESYDFLSGSNLYGGELLLPNIGASVGDVYIVPKLYERMSLAPNAIMVKNSSCDKFYFYFFSCDSGRLALEDIAESTAQPKFNKTDFRNLRLPAPPTEEQQAIADYLDEKCAAIDAMVAEKEALIADLEAYKKSLIYEVVTGKREVA